MSAAGRPDHFFPLWLADYLADTTHLTTILHGAYLLLLMAYWRRQGPLPDDDDLLRSMAKMDRGEWRRARPVLSNFFQISDGRWHQRRADAELADAKKRAEIAAEKGRRGGEAARGKSGRKPRLAEYQGNSSAITKAAKNNSQLIPSHLSPSSSSNELEESTATQSSIEGIDPPQNGQDTVLKNGGHNGHANGEAKIARHTEFPSDDDLDYCANHWNEKAAAFGLPQIEKLTEPRRRQLRARLRDGGDLASFCCTVNDLDTMPFLLGQSRPRNGSDAPFKADFDWIIKAANWQKIIEGKYKR